MATLTFTIPDAALPRVVDAFATAYGYQALIGDPPVANPETRGQFMRRHVMEFIKNTVQAVEVNVAAETARATEIAKPTVSVT